MVEPSRSATKGRGLQAADRIRTREPVLWAALATGSALVLGGAAVADTVVALAFALGLALVLIVTVRPAALLVILTATVSLSVVTLSGVTISRIAAPLTLLVVLAALIRGAGSLRPAAPLLWVFLFALWAVASGFWSVSPGGTAFQLGSLAIAVVYMLAFASLLSSRSDLDRVLYSFAVTALGVGIFGIVSSRGRAEGISGDANAFALVQVVALPLVIVLASEARRLWARAGLYVVAVTIVVSVLASLSRGGLLTLLAVTLLALTIPARTFFRSRGQKALVILLLCTGAGYGFQTTAQALPDRIDAIFVQEDRTGSGRLNAWRAAWAAIQERPVLGLGYGGFDPSANDLLLRTPGVDLSNQNLRPEGLKAHSTFIGTLAELGVPGLLLLLGILGSTARALWRTARRAHQVGSLFLARAASALLVSLIGWSVGAMFLSAETARTLWIIIGISLALPKLLPAQAWGRAPGTPPGASSGRPLDVRGSRG